MQRLPFHFEVLQDADFEGPVQSSDTRKYQLAVALFPQKKSLLRREISRIPGAAMRQPCIGTLEP